MKKLKWEAAEEKNKGLLRNIIEERKAENILEWFISVHPLRIFPFALTQNQPQLLAWPDYFPPPPLAFLPARPAYPRGLSTHKVFCSVLLSTNTSGSLHVLSSQVWMCVLINEFCLQIFRVCTVINRLHSQLFRMRDCLHTHYWHGAREPSGSRNLYLGKWFPSRHCCLL